MEPLGMESGEIHSDQITASSQYSTNWSSERSRLNYPENGWTPGEDSYREWIQVCCLRPGTFRAEEDFGHLEKLGGKAVPTRCLQMRREGKWAPSRSVKSSFHDGTPSEKKQAQNASLKIHVSFQILTYD